MSGAVILVDDEEDIRVSLEQTLELGGFDVTTFARPERALDRIGPGFDGVVVSDIRMPRMSGIDLLGAALEIDPTLPVILITGHGDVPLAVEALGKGAYDFIEKPFASDRLVSSIRRALEKRRMAMEIRGLRARAAAPAADPLDDMILGHAPEIAELRRKIRTIAGTTLDVLVTGETGTGKEAVARAIHALSDRPGGPFVALNLAALPAEHVEAELFGYVASAFPGAVRARTGRLEHARGGTVYLDEIGSAPMSLQAKLLRVIEERAILPLGAAEPVELDLRFVASSRQPLEDLVEAGTFRDDLLYRVNPVTLRLPPLRARAGDIARIYQRFIQEAADRFGREAPQIGPGAMIAVSQRPWPGNLRELKSAAERHVLGLDGDPAAGARAASTLAEQVEAFERDTIAAALASTGGNLKATYESLGLARKTLYEKMQRHGLKRQDFEG
ncbi:sigma-54 dependent transcriptional regulator [Roseicyclus sp. F158]|uniref:Sigma-54 dependent transcriptional regulator n=1 Tax=Tropicimonas omnivorans TaxID=3075590 RepID=A0ABU3DCU0_9RHOB|nr:sigma-54 dependent transcriptional regulator [Roseicyclus sp. F158]MDT0681534.1 sigma-54 dependent transcriptional regulator [Roseicyclus sp. F158]